MGSAGARRRRPEKQEAHPSANTPFTSGRRIRGEGRLCEPALTAQVSAGEVASMPGVRDYDPASEVICVMCASSPDPSPTVKGVSPEVTARARRM
ncbi:hypothetical protein GCM10009564_29760 [Streptomyces thermogriseus]|uniref:Uncharacterized protein n=1 Tax=Streptomyces thermogriseus TaxID=75292 RepID=A0ABN1T0S3_9ACTN